MNPRGASVDSTIDLEAPSASASARVGLNSVDRESSLVITPSLSVAENLVFPAWKVKDEAQDG
ncbi:hypothetical protein GCM10009673_27560 [Nesterenkonia sandarakina]